MAALPGLAQAESPAEVPCTWSSLPFGGGVIGGLVNHSREPGLSHARVERGGVCRRDPLPTDLENLGWADWRASNKRTRPVLQPVDSFCSSIGPSSALRGGRG